MAGAGQPRAVSVIDISCPSCGSEEGVRKEGIGTYRCVECGHEFDHDALDPLEQSDDGG